MCHANTSEELHNHKASLLWICGASLLIFALTCCALSSPLGQQRKTHVDKYVYRCLQQWGTCFQPRLGRSHWVICTAGTFIRPIISAETNMFVLSGARQGDVVEPGCCSWSPAGGGLDSISPQARTSWMYFKQKLTNWCKLDHWRPKYDSVLLQGGHIFHIKWLYQWKDAGKPCAFAFMLACKDILYWKIHAS